MTQPDRIPINPESIEGLERWLRIDQSEDGFISVELGGSPGMTLRFQRELDEFEAERIRREIESAQGDYRVLNIAAHEVQLVPQRLRLSRRDWCVLADWCGVELWKDKVAMDDELEAAHKNEGGDG